LNGVREIAKGLLDLSGSVSPYEVFSDWITAMAIAISNACHIIHGKVWQEREKQYMNIIQKYPDHGMEFSKLFGLLMVEMETNPRDVLGEIYMECGFANKHLGQVFTPPSLCRMCAELSIDDYDGSAPITVNEPACGGGAMIIELCTALQRKVINYQKAVRVTAQDLDWKGVYMCYVQLSLMGVNAVVVQGDTLANPYTGHNADPSHIFYTPMYMMSF
jgi:type I restriction-modification system DNA methylase subunit